MAVARVLPKVKRDNTTCCGYWLANRAARFRYQHIIDFSTLTSLDQVTTAGWGISHGWQIAGANPSTGQVAMANENNVKLVRGVGLTLTVPGRGYFEVEAKVTSVPGTIFEIMTLHGDPWDAPLGWQDTGAMKIGSSTLMKGNSYGLSPGTQMANVHPE
ncbi:hypothetical protein QFC22_003781 [Naganishia vaughanmartiniae]|uniref:Uncharacterized protein n=1 Tax=Naganishia vaughanmartiniae TaxID=1424756 RepID=A0ACC2X567_9TREE|nr:hypothetical protein QFC22_003781 [Naganishia vaughanmartiniae]